MRKGVQHKALRRWVKPPRQQPKGAKRYSHSQPTKTKEKIMDRKLFMLNAFLTACVASEDRGNCYYGGTDIVFDSIGKHEDSLYVSCGDEGYEYELIRTHPETGKEKVISKGSLESVSQLKKLVEADKW